MTKPRIKMSPFGESFYINADHHLEAQYDWIDGTFLQGGDKGLVISRSADRKSYLTHFVEAFPPESHGGGFFRGEGESVAEAETGAWNKYQLSIACPAHEWEKRGYRNGAGFCKNCNKFGSKVFTGEQLGQFCASCNVGTYYGNVKDLNEEDRWYCEVHFKKAERKRFDYLSELNRDISIPLPENLRLEFNRLRFMLGEEDDGEY